MSLVIVGDAIRIQRCLMSEQVTDKDKWKCPYCGYETSVEYNEVGMAVVGHPKEQCEEIARARS